MHPSGLGPLLLSHQIARSLAMRCVTRLCRTHRTTLIAVIALQDLQRILTRSLDLLYSGTTNSSGLQVDCDFLLVIKTMETQLLAWHHEWLNIRTLGLGPHSLLFFSIWCA